MTLHETPPATVREDIIRMEGKLDAYAAGQSERLNGVDRRLDQHDTDIAAIRANQAALSAPRTPTSGWTVAAVIISGVVGLGALLGLLVTLMQLVPGKSS